MPSEQSYRKRTMTQPIQQLTDEHGRIRGMLSCFEAQLDRFERAERPDYEILEGSIAYCQEYLDRWHHPREDALLELLQRRAPPEAGACAELEELHLRLARTTGEVVKVFEEVERDAEYSRARLVEMGRILVDDYRRHLDWEEANFFPALRGHLLPEDWREIAPRFADASDPLTQSPIDQRYRILFSALDEP
ncbi:MAG: hypothetical protein CMM50_11980 [Rhodospirillaceae bacterium]|nr:hypothetical protein [Rhodospirillaceae bacterium]